MVKKQGADLLKIVTWLTGVLVSLSVGFAMIDGILSLPFWLGGKYVAIIVGWIVIITTFASAVLAILKK
jgi:choline-glycine betaine transporter